MGGRAWACGLGSMQALPFGPAHRLKTPADQIRDLVTESGSVDRGDGPAVS